MNPSQIIARKRDGHALTRDEIAFAVRVYAQGELPDYQMAALAMAIFLRGMSADETASLTAEMLHSGRTLNWPAGPPRVDKHSSGGLGDKVSLILAPLLACCGLRVPMISGRGLGITGGTLDKLEAIPGFRTDLSLDEVVAVTERIGCVITGATADLAPADRKLYALRDVTGTVPSIPLITASIMSKKLAENLDALVLDVKFGSGAFMKSLDQARELAASLVATGQRMGVKTSALLTDMNQPLGRCVGNGLEVAESLATLRGEGPADLWQVTAALGSELLVATGTDPDATAAERRLLGLIRSGAACEKFQAMVRAQGGDPDVPLRRAAEVREVVATDAGYVAAIDCEALGYAVIELGGGRRVLTDRIDHAVGLEMCVRIGDAVAPGQPLVRVHAGVGGFDRVARSLAAAFRLSLEAVAPPKLIAREPLRPQPKS